MTDRDSPSAYLWSRSLTSSHWRLVKLALLLALAGLVCIDLSLFGRPFLQLALGTGIVGLAFILLVFFKPAIGLYILTLLLFSLHWLTDSLQVLPKPFNLVPDVLVVALFLRGLYGRLRWRKTLPRTQVDAFVLLLIGVAILSALLNHSDPVLVFLNGLFRQNLKFFLLFYAIVYLAPPENTLRRLVVLLIGLEVLQVPVAVVQAFVYKNWDFAGGTLGFASTDVLALSALMMMALLFGLAQTTGRMRYALLGLSLFIPAVVGEGKIVFILGPILILFLLSYRRALLSSKAVLLLLLFIVAYGLSLFALNVIFPQAKSLRVLSSISYTLRIYERPLVATGGFPRSRLGDLQFTACLLREGVLRAFFGYGPGSSSRAFVEAATGSLYRRFEVYEGPYFYFSFVQLSTTALEYGCAGLMVYLLLLWRLYRWNGELLRGTNDKFWWAIAWGFRGVIFVFVSGMVYWRVWSTEILASIFWMLAGILTVHSNAERSDSRLEPQLVRPDTLCVTAA